MPAGRFRDPGDLVGHDGVTGVKAFARRLNTTSAQALCDHLRSLEQQLNTALDRYYLVRQRLESWDSESGELARQAISRHIARADLIIGYASALRTSIEDVQGTAQQTATRVVELRDEQIEYSPQIREQNLAERAAAQSFLRELSESCLIGKSRIQAAIGEVGGLPTSAQPRPELLASPYPEPIADDENAASGIGEHTALQSAPGGVLAPEQPLAPPTGRPIMASPTLPVGTPGAAFTLNSGVLEEDTNTSGRSGALPPSRGTARHRHVDVCPTCGSDRASRPQRPNEPWAGPVIGVDERGLVEYREEQQRVISAYRYTRELDR